MTRLFTVGFSLLLVGGLALRTVCWASRPGPNPTVLETEEGRVLVLPQPLTNFLDSHFPGYRLPEESAFDEEMLAFYHSRLIGVHPAIAWGDFNGNRHRDYALMLITGDTPWGPLIEVVILNGTRRRNEFSIQRIGELYNFSRDYLSFQDDKLYKGSFKRGGWHINWDPRKKTYNTLRS